MLCIYIYICFFYINTWSVNSDLYYAFCQQSFRLILTKVLVNQYHNLFTAIDSKHLCNLLWMRPVKWNKCKNKSEKCKIALFYKYYSVEWSIRCLLVSVLFPLFLCFSTLFFKSLKQLLVSTIGTTSICVFQVKTHLLNLIRWYTCDLFI